MYGYPGVSWVTGASGQRVNDPAQRYTTRPAQVRLDPGASAYALVTLVQTGNYPPATCQPVQATGFRVYPPDETASVFASYPQQVCSANGVGLATVYPVQPAG